MEMIPLYSVLAVGLVGFALMVAAFVLIARAGGWQRAMQPTPEGRWPWARRLMALGAGLGCLFGVLLSILRFIPGGIPWIK
jgi:hypothetical protein